MDEDQQQQSLEKVVGALSPKERSALTYFRESNQVMVAKELNEKLYDLFKYGRTCDEIRKLMPGITLGQIVAARLKFGWDERRLEERTELMEKLPAEVMQIQGEAVDFLARLLAVNHKLYNDQMDKFLLDGNKEHLKDLPIGGAAGLTQYRALLESLMKVTGQGNKKVIEHRGSVDVNHTKAPVTQEEAGNILDVLAIPVDK